MAIFRYSMMVLIALLAAACLTPATALAEAKKSFEYGDITLDRTSKGGTTMPVIFRHWVHRAKHSCRLCHVDLEFAMHAGQTGITEDDNKAGRYCGTCHNGKEAFAVDQCSRCHPKDAQSADEMNLAAKKQFFAFAKNLPKSLYGNKINWNQAEDEGLLKTKDFIEGVSFPDKSPITNSREEARKSTAEGLPGIIFSHPKHATWTGCGMCHPEPFALEIGATKMTMKEITNGQYCGMCHGKVAFPLYNCAECHSKPVQQ